MSRRSLRLHTSASHYGDDSLLDHHSASYSREKTLKSRRSCHSVLESAPNFQTPRFASTSVLQAHNSTLNSCAPSDASLLSSLLDESSIQERTLVDSFWGLDEEREIHDQPIVSQLITMEAKMQTSTTQNGYISKDHPIPSPTKNDSSLNNTAVHQASLTEAPSTATTVYCRDKNRKHKPGNQKYISTMSVKEVVLQKEQPKFSGVLWKAASNSILWLVNLFTTCLPMLSKVLFLVPLLLFLALYYWGPSGLIAMLPATSMMRDNSHLSPPTSSMGGLDEGQTTADTDSQRPSVVSSVEAERLMRLEESVSQLWDRVAGGLLRQEEQHTEMLSLYNTLRSEIHGYTDRESLGKWIGDMLEERFSLLKGEVQKEVKYTQQRQEKHAEERQSENTRLAEAEALLQTLARKTEELQRKQEPTLRKVPEAEAPSPDPQSEEAESSAAEALLVEVRRLEDALERIRDDVQGLMKCRDKCEQLDSFSGSVSAQVKEEIKSLFYGNDVGAAELELPESLLQWISDHFVSTSELQTSLSALESSILGNLSLQVEEGQLPSKETITKTVLNAAGEAGLSEEHVQLIVTNAIKLYSEDRIGMVDYALESGGGSIISTRCSESFNTKTALLSLFGLPLWYFSQSPRVVIQPEVHPGNCWAFKGSTGYIVIGLSMKIVPTAFTLEHVAKSLSPTGNISSAPREFNVYGLDDEQQEEGQLLGQYVYEEDGDSLQTFLVSDEVSSGFQIIEMRVLSNWGNPEYTCVYRFRVHGKPS
ncbi:SUN domain-containing protein 1 isoform X11 [Danio rerio]